MSFALTKEELQEVRSFGKKFTEVNGEEVKAIFELPAKLQKSYYGKAKVIETETGRYLLSYTTLICKVDTNGILNKFWRDYSVTTMKHINDFLAYCGLSAMNKKSWLA